MSQAPVTIQQSSTILIIETTGPLRRLQLNGPALPFQSAAWSGQQRMTTKWYTGNNAEGTQQVLGPIELPSDWEGFWRSTQLISCPSKFLDEDGSVSFITRASTLRDVVESIGQAGQRLQVVWSTGEVATVTDYNGGADSARKIVRVGRMKEWKFPHDRMDDIGWNMTFEWMGRGRTTQKAVALRGENEEASRRNALMRLTDAVSQLTATNQITANKLLQMANSNATSLSLGDLENLARAPQMLVQSLLAPLQQVINRMQQLGNLVIALENMPFEIANQGLAVATSATGMLNRFIDTITSTPSEMLSMNNNVSQVLQAASFYGSTYANVEHAIDAAIEMEQNWRTAVAQPRDGGGRSPNATTIQASAISTYITKHGDTYAAISQRFYGTPDHSYAIARANAPNMPMVSKRIADGSFVQLKASSFDVSPPVGLALVIPPIATVRRLEST